MQIRALTIIWVLITIFVKGPDAIFQILFFIHMFSLLLSCWFQGHPFTQYADLRIQKCETPYGSVDELDYYIRLNRINQVRFRFRRKLKLVKGHSIALQNSFASNPRLSHKK